MLVFVDESGDPGFKLDRGSSPVFVTSMVIFETVEDAIMAENALRELQVDMRCYPEFKFSKLPNKKRIEFFQKVSHLNFTCRAVVVQKKLIYSPALRTVKESFYKFFIRMMIQNDAKVLKNAKLVIDGSGDRRFKREFRSYLSKHVSKDVIRKCELKDSQKDYLVQLADMTAGAIARSYRPDREASMVCRNLLNKNGQLDNLWEFK